MTVELTRRLIESGVPLPDIEAALLLVVAHGLSLTEALTERDPRLASRVEQELARSELPSVLTVRASPELFARLPRGLCRRLLAVPVHVDPRTGRVDVAAVEPLDPHIAQELSFHFEQPVRVLAAPLDAVKAALDKLQQVSKISAAPANRAPGALGSDAPIPLVRLDSGARSDAPIPLVRRSLAPRGSSAPPQAAAILPGAPEREELSMSWRSKPPPLDLVIGADAARGARVASAPPEAPSAPSPREQLEAATTPEVVLEVLRDALAPAASLVFAVKNASFDGRVASPSVEARCKPRDISLLSHQPSVLETAVESGFYLGPIPNTPNHRELRDALPPDAVHEVYVTVVTVSDRPSLVWLLAGFEQSLDLTRRADEIALIAGRALTRILRQRKRSG